MTDVPRTGRVTDPSADARERLEALVTRRFERSIAAPGKFFDTNAAAVSAATLDMARRFHAGGRLIVFGEGAGATDAQHVSVEFIHPVIVGKRALPAIALTNDVASLTASAGEPDGDHRFEAMLRTLGRSGDIALGLCGSETDGPTTGALDRAREMSMLTIAVASDPDSESSLSRVDHVFTVLEEDPFVSQEVGETLYHILWELVHVFLDHMPEQSGLIR